MKDENDKAGRQKTKGGNYCLQYNAMPPTLARTVGVPLEEAKRFHEIYWDINWAWREVNTRLEKQWESRNKKGVLCPVSGAFLYITSKNILGSWTVQHTGSFAMDLAGCIMDEWLGGITRDEKGLPCYYYKGKKAVRILYMHDEYLWECDPEIADDILAMGIESITEAGRRLELKVELSADGSVGNTWADVH
jgi:DNA polymerase I-like protein with 3'-5' exonuclease and polymerase domains